MNENCDLKPRVIKTDSKYPEINYKLGFYSSSGLKSQVYVSFDNVLIKLYPQGDKKYGLIAWRMYTAHVGARYARNVELSSFEELIEQ